MSKRVKVGKDNKKFKALNSDEKSRVKCLLFVSELNCQRFMGRGLRNQGPMWAAHGAGTARRCSHEGMCSDFTEEKKNSI